MKTIENFVGNQVRTYLYFDIGFVDGELADDLQWYLQLHVVNARGLNESVNVGQKDDRVFPSDVIRYEVALADINIDNVENIKELIMLHTNAWVASMGGRECVN
jgi:hypothetical protein